MMLALWFDFWDAAVDWQPPVSPAQPDNVDSPTDAGGGGKKNPNDYDRDMTPPGFWDVREAYLRSLFEKTKPDAEEPIVESAVDEPDVKSERRRDLANFFPRYTNDIAESISGIRLAENTRQLTDAGVRLAELNTRMDAARKAQLTAEKAESDARAKRFADRAGKKKAALAAAKLLLRTIGKSY